MTYSEFGFFLWPNNAVREPSQALTEKGQWAGHSRSLGVLWSFPIGQVGVLMAMLASPHHRPSVVLHSRAPVGGRRDWELPEQCDWKNSTWSLLLSPICPRSPSNRLPSPPFETLLEDKALPSTMLCTGPGKFADSLWKPGPPGWWSFPMPPAEQSYRAKGKQLHIFPGTAPSSRDCGILYSLQLLSLC